MEISVRRLIPGDESVLNLLAHEDADFDVERRGEPLQPLDAEAARHFLHDPGVLHWIAEREGIVLGFLLCHVLKMRATVKQEVLLYEIGVRHQYRRRGIGQALQKALEFWMRENDVSEVWVLADNPEAISFYESCGFEIGQDSAVYMTRTLPRA